MSAKAIDIRKLLVATVLMLPLVSCFWYVAVFGVNLPYQDDWAFMHEAGRMLLHDPNATLLRFLNHQHNDHKMGVPFSILFCIGIASGWNWVAMMYGNVVLHSLANILLMVWAWAQMKLRSLPLLILLPIPLVMCSFRQWENMLFAFQTCIYSVHLFFLLSLILLARSRGLDWKFYTAMLSAFLACYCNGNGLLTLPLGLLALILQWTMTLLANEAKTAEIERDVSFGASEDFKASSLKRSEGAVAKLKILIWTGVSGFVSLLYFSSYEHQSFFKFKLAYLSENFRGVIKFLIAPFGTLYANDVHNAILWGILFLLTLCLTLFICIKRRILDRFVITAWMIILFCVAFDLLVFWGRCGFALDPVLSAKSPDTYLNAICSRYSTTNALGLVGLYLLTVHTFRRGWLSIINAACVCALISCCIYVSMTVGITMSEVWHDYRLTEKTIVENQELVTDDQLKRIFPEPGVMRRFKKTIERLHLFHYSHEKFPSHLPVTKEPVALVTYVNGKVDAKGQWHVGTNSDIVIRGWTWDRDAKKPATAVWVFVDEKPLILAAYGLTRTDLKSFGPRMRWGRTGFESVFSAKQIGAGLHEVSLKVISSDGKRCMDTGTQVLLLVE